MRTRTRAFLSAFPSAMLVTILMAVFCVFCGYLLAEWGEGALEALGAVPRGWGSAHDRAMVLGAFAATLPLIVRAAVGYFRQAVAAEAELLEHSHS